MDFAVKNVKETIDIAQNTVQKVRERPSVQKKEAPVQKAEDVQTSSKGNISSSPKDENNNWISKEDKLSDLLDEKEVAKAVAEMNKDLGFSKRSFEYNVEERTQRIIIKVIDTETKEIIKEIPPEKQVDAIRRMQEMAGLIVDEKV